MATPTDIILLRYSDVNPRYGIKSSNILDSGLEAINSSIENILGTSFGERLFLPEFGSRIGNLLFENINDETAQNIFDELTNAINNWEPRIEVVLDESYIVPDPDNNSYQIFLVYRLVDIDLRGEFQANISNF